VSETTPPETAEQIIGRELVDGETLLWSGQPDRGAYGGSNPFRSVFGRVVLIIGLIMLYMGYDAVSANPKSPGVFGIMFGLILAIFGGGLAARTFWNWWSAPTTYYGVTNKRAIIARTKPWFNIKNFNNLQIEMVASEPFGSRGLGNVIFATEPFGRLRALRAAVGFWGVENPDGAEEALKRLKDYQG